MMIKYSSLILFLILCNSIHGKDIITDYENDDVTKEYCGNYAECRSIAKKHFENCVGGFTEMFMMLSTKFSNMKSSDSTIKCEKNLIETIETEIKPFYEKMEFDTFTCASQANPLAFNLDQSQKIKCKLIQSEVHPESFAIQGIKDNNECKEAYENQLRRCDLLKECCPQYNHCRVKAEVEGQAFGKEDSLAREFDNCLKKQDVDYHSPTAETTTELLPVAPESESEENLDGHSTTIEKRKAPLPRASTESPVKIETPATLATLPPPDKVFNDLVGLLFPALKTTTTTVKPTTTTPELTTVSLRRIQAEQDALAAKQKFLKKFQFSDYAKLQEKAKYFDSLSPETKSLLLKRRGEPNKTKVLSEVKTRHENTESTTARPTTASSTIPSTISPKTTVSTTKRIVTTSTIPPTTTTVTDPPSTTIVTNPPPSTTQEIKQTSSASKKESKKNSHHKLNDNESVTISGKAVLSRMFCEEYIECQEIIDKEYKKCDDKYNPEPLLYGIKDYHLRQQFINNSNVDDDVVKHKCMDAVDPESQRQLSLLKHMVNEQVKNCTRKVTVSSVSSTKLDKCTKLKLLTLISDLFNQNHLNGKSVENVQKCYQQVRKLERQCSVLQECCPQNYLCSSSNNRSESRKYNEIIDQLKEEQNLCEKRRMRILNGLV